MHLEQLLYKGSISLIRWNELNMKFKGRKPNWWTDLKKKVIDENQQLTLKFKDKIDINKIISSNKGILPYLNLDGRKKNWITGKMDMEKKNLDGSVTKEMIQIYGRLLTKKKQISTSNSIKIEHFCMTKTLSGKLALMKCQNQLCNYGTWENETRCIVELEKLNCLVIRGKSKPMGENKFRIYQSEQNIKDELIKWLHINETNVDNLALSSNVVVGTSIFHEKEYEIRKCCNQSQKTSKLVEIYQNNIKNNNRPIWEFYTDGSLKTIDDTKKMAIGWILVNTNDSNSIEVEFSAANLGWPSSTKAEVLAILSTILVVLPHSNMKIYTDSKNAIQQFEQYKKELSVRRQLKINNQISWNTITYLLEKYKIDLELIKVKAHSDNWGNNEADRVANKGLYEDYWILNDHLVTSKYNIAWYNIKVEMGARKFTKILNQTRRSLESENLKRIEKLSNIDKKISYKILNANRDDTFTGR